MRGVRPWVQLNRSNARGFKGGEQFTGGLPGDAERSHQERGQRPPQKLGTIVCRGIISGGEMGLRIVF